VGPRRRGGEGNGWKGDGRKTGKGRRERKKRDGRGIMEGSYPTDS